MDELFQKESFEIDLDGLLLWLKKKILWVIISALAGCLLMLVIGTVRYTPTYSATSMLYALGSSDQDMSLTDVQISNQLVNDYDLLISSRSVVEESLKTLKLDMSYESARGMIDVSNPKGTHILNIKVTSTDPDTAYRLANAVADTASVRLAEIMSTTRLNVAEYAVKPEMANTNSVLKNAATATVFCGFMALLVLFVIYLLDDTLKVPEDIERYLGIPALGSIPMQTELRQTGTAKKGRNARKNMRKVNRTKAAE